MTKVLKESFYEANFRVDEEFDNAELAAKSNSPSDNAKVTVLDLKLDKSRIKLTDFSMSSSVKRSDFPDILFTRSGLFICFIGILHFCLYEVSDI